MSLNDRYLFRGKRLNNGEWVQGNLVENWQFGSDFIPAVIRPRQIEFHQDYTQKTYAIAVDPATVEPVAVAVVDDGAFGECPACGAQFNSELMNEYQIAYCHRCGQRLDWSLI